MSIKFLIVDEYLQEIRKCFGVILRKMVTIAKSSLCEERKTKKIGEISAVSPETLKSVGLSMMCYTLGKE